MLISFKQIFAGVDVAETEGTIVEVVLVNTDVVPEPLLATIISGLPSPFKSATFVSVVLFPVAILVAVPLQIVWPLADTVGTGLTITSAVIGVPEHPFAPGVMV